MTNEELKELKRFILNASLAQGFATYLALRYKDSLPSFTEEEEGSLHSELMFYRKVMSEMLSREGHYPIEKEFPEVFGTEAKDVARVFDCILEGTLRKVRSE